MRRLFQPALLLAVVVIGTLTIVEASQRPTFNTNKNATLIMKDGTRHSGTLVYHNDNDFNLIQNGQEKSYPIDQVAVVEFEGGTPNASELNNLSTSANPPELQRHMLTLNDGSTIKGKMHTITENAISFDNEQGQRQQYPLSNVKRMYMSAAGSRELFASQLSSSQGSTGTTGQQTPSGAIRVEGNRDWTDTGITVRRGQRIGFSTSGQVAFRGSEQVGPDGSPNEPRNGLAVQQVGVGGLIGRVGTGAPFAIGSNSQLIAMPANGRLYLGINDTGVGDNSGAFTVTIVR
jgi:PA-IL-like protein